MSWNDWLGGSIYLKQLTKQGAPRTLGTVVI